MRAIKTLVLISLGFVAVALGQGSPRDMNQANPSQSNTEPGASPGHSTMDQDQGLNSGSANRRDAVFAQEAAAGGMAEVKLGQLAQEKGSSEAVKAFGKRMEIDHSKAGDQLKEVASKNNITLPNDVNEKDRTTYDRLSKLSGAAFDQAYASGMVTDHENVIAQFKKEASSGTNSDVKKFASQTLPTLEVHLKQAREMENGVSVKTSSNTQ
jgi:putative membrane protein